MSNLIKIGIRQLVEFCCRSGDLGFESGPGPSAQEGLRTHQKIQKRYQDEALAEYRLNFSLEIDGFEIELGGRIDLLFENENPPRVEEIKTIYSLMNAEVERFEESHWAQVKCYAAVYALQENIETLQISLTYANLFNLQEYRQTRLSNRAELVEFLQQTLRRYIKWHELISSQHEETLASTSKLEFPYAEFRQQQHHFASQVYRNIQRKGHLMVEAPTGSGKTISTLFPSIKAIGENLIDQIVYLSAKTSGQNQAITAIEQMCDQGLHISYLVLQAKSKSCACNHNPDEINIEGKCLRTLGFFDRLTAARETLMRHRRINTEAIQQIAEEHRLCPFELSLQMLPWVDIVIADLNYVFDPLVQPAYFKNDNRRKLLLIDELHNLIDRARGMYSASISRRQIELTIAADNSSTILKALTSLKGSLDKRLREQANDEQIEDETDLVFARAASRFSEKLDLNLFNNKKICPETFEFAKAIYRYQCIHQLYGQRHKTIRIKPVGQRQIKLNCLNAFEYLREVYPLFDSVCGFSATLTPGEYFLQALGFDETAKVLRLESCFPGEKLQVSICSYVDTRYRQREKYIEQICQTINRCYRARPGNYLVFFSSYYFMQQVFDHFQQHFDDIPTLIQTRDLNDNQRREFIDSFYEHKNTLGFAIMGGIFAEGIDYLGQSLIGAIVVGVGLPQANTEQQLIEQDFSRLSLNGFDYAYRFPGLIRVQQSAGRVIRSETDIGVVILLDRRFQQSAYRQHFPSHWQPGHCQDIDKLEQDLLQFWESQH